VRIVIARCSVEYSGRLSASLPPATRLLLVKADGSVLVHADGGAYRPLNWMSAPCTLEDTPLDDGGTAAVWQVRNRSGEQMTVQLEEIFSDVIHELGPDPGLVKDGVERQLQLLLAEHCDVLGEGWSLIKREYPTDIGPVDLMCRDASGALVAVEIKRRGEIDGSCPNEPTASYVAVEIKRKATLQAVEQISRYLERLKLDPFLQPVRGAIAALEIPPQVRVLAESRGISCHVVNLDELRGIEPKVPTLF
jgi:RecB family endonuclease NucS